MKEILKAYFSFNRAERLGIIALMSLLIVLILVKATMHFWVQPPVDKAKEQELITAWEQFKSQQQSVVEPQVDTKAVAAITQSTTPKKSKTITYSKLFEFDPNTVDSATLRQLGLREKTTSIFLHWRAKGKKFYKKDEFRKVYTLTDEEYQRLEPYIVIH